jgi:hypothetical protein
MNADHLEEAIWMARGMLVDISDGYRVERHTVEQLLDFLMLAKVERPLPAKPTGE